MSVLNRDDKGNPPTLEQIMAEVNKNVDARVRGAFDDFKKTGLSEALKPHLEPVSTQLGTMNQALEKLLSNNQPPPDNSGGGKPPIPPEINAQLKELGEKLRAQASEVSTLKAGKEQAEKRAEETERHSSIRTALQGLPFVNDKAADTAFQLVLPHVKRLDDQSLVAGVGGDNFPIDTFSRDYLQKDHNYLFRATGSGGSGAPITVGQTRMGARADLDNIKVGMKAEDRQATIEAISAAMAAA